MKKIGECLQNRNLRLKSRYWIEDDTGKILIGEGRARILETIERTGSINKAAKELGMSYRAVWGKIKVSEQVLGFDFVHREGRSGSTLTEEGKKFLECYHELKRRCTESDDYIFHEIYSQKKVKPF